MKGNHDITEAVYIHIPFCLQKCHYCDFLSVPKPDEMERYIQALCKEMELGAGGEMLQVKSIFIGGGTPTCLPVRLLSKLLEAVERLFVGADLLEYTVEANPGTLTKEKLALLHTHAVNRLSMGVQSDHSHLLQRLGRMHSFHEVQENLTMARAVGFKNLNLDLMYGLPGQTVAQWEQTLHHVLSLSPEHISLYQLKIEEGTPFYQQLQQGEMDEFDEEQALMMYRLAQNITGSYGYQQYEISNYAKPGCASRHNQVYWRTENYLGFGLGACTFLRPYRWENYDEFSDYYQALDHNLLPRMEEDPLSRQALMEETVFMALRMNQGLEKAMFQGRYGCTLEEVFPAALERCCKQGWLTEKNGFWQLTEKGRVLGNLVFLEFIE